MADYPKIIVLLSPFEFNSSVFPVLPLLKMYELIGVMLLVKLTGRYFTGGTVIHEGPRPEHIKRVRRKEQ